MTVSLHRHRHPTAEVRHVQDQQPEQIAAGNDGTGNGEIPKPLMFTKELFHNNPRTLKNFSRLSISETGAVHFDDCLSRLIQRHKIVKSFERQK